VHPGFIPRNHPNAVKKQGVDDAVDDRQTPASVFDPLNEEFHFTLDVAAARHNSQCKRYYALGPSTPVEKRQASLWDEPLVGDPEALGYDGLAQPWADDEVVWANPPFSDLEPWIAKAHAASCTVVMLLPANRTEQPHWQTYIEPHRDRPGSVLSTRFLAGRRSFLHQGEVIGNSTSKAPPFGIVIVIWDRRARVACPSRHGTDACCTACIGATDGLGFPHPNDPHAKGLRRLQQCPVCKAWVDPANWVHDIDGARFGCLACAGPDAFAAGAVENVTLNAAERGRVKSLIEGSKPRRRKVRVTGSVAQELEDPEMKIDRV
jgi:hypothetical protein